MNPSEQRKPQKADDCDVLELSAAAQSALDESGSMKVIVGDLTNKKLEYKVRQSFTETVNESENAGSDSATRFAVELPNFAADKRKDLSVDDTQADAKRSKRSGVPLGAGGSLSL